VDKQRVIFLCTGNSARSQMAEAILRKYGGERFEVYSAGLVPKGIHPFTFQVMKEKGFDLSAQYSKVVDEYLGKVLLQTLITLCDDAEKNCPTVWPGVYTRLHWAFEDPSAFEGTDEQRLDKFRLVRDQIEMKIKDWLK
jgi:arsenate reductase